MPLVGVIIGSKSDEPQIQPTLLALNEMGIDHELEVISAHRRPAQVMEYAQSAESRGLEVVIAAAGGAAALPGVVASWTILPVIGIPFPSSELKGVDSLYSIVQMPPGVPVATVAIGAWGARNAAYLAAAILGLNHGNIRKAYVAFRERLRKG